MEKLTFIYNALTYLDTKPNITLEEAIKTIGNLRIWLEAILKSNRLEKQVRREFCGQYSQGIAEDGAVILLDGKPMTPDLIVQLLNDYSELQKIHFAKLGNFPIEQATNPQKQKEK